VGSSRIVIDAMRALPKGAISRLAGRVATARLPRPLLAAGIRAFGGVFGVDFSEAREPIGSFATFQEFFTRELRDGVRPIDPAPDAFVSPCDGVWGASGEIRDGTLLQVKGREYSLAALLGGQREAVSFEGGTFATLYLSPRDYHRFHTPCDVEVVSARHLVGTLWPVNRLGLEGVDGLFAQNERICAWMRVAGSGGAPGLCLVAVGATMVGSVRVDFDDLTTNVLGAVTTTRTYEPPVAYARGAEWGRFEFGSTMVLVAAPGVVALDLAAPDTPVRLGTRMGTLLGSGASRQGRSS
jgi:phosphatidylserine decarboxylase